MRKCRRPSYLLIQVLALLPLIVVATALTTQLANEAIGAQHVAVISNANDGETRRILRCLQEDASAASTARVERNDSGCDLILEQRGNTVTYRAERRDLGNTIVVMDGNLERMRFNLRGAAIDFDIESIGKGGHVVWIRCAFSYRWSGSLKHTWSLSGAARVGDGSTR